MGNGLHTNVTGTVKFWHQKGYGFLIVDADDRDVFCHISALPDGMDGLRPGQKVLFDTETAKKGERAVNVRLR